MEQPYPNWVEVNLSAVGQNTRRVLARAGVPLMAVVKGDAYGHGAVAVAQAALAEGAAWLGVARMGEARVLRAAGLDAPILVFGMVTPDEVDEAIANRVTLALPGFQALEMFAGRALALGKRLAVHIKVDTGLGRLGVLPWDLAGLAQAAQSSPAIELDGVYSHFAMMDDDELHPMNTVQVERFDEAVAAMHAQGIFPRYLHMGNSVAVEEFPRARYNLMRAGIGLLGVRPLPEKPFPEYMRRSLSWKVRLVSCKLYPQGWGVSYGQEYICAQDEWIGVLPLGYADGFLRAPGNQVLIGGRRIPVVGRICMDTCMVRLPHPFDLGEEVVVIGRQGNEEITAEELSERWGITEVGVSIGINFRVPRVYTRDPVNATP